MRGWIIHIVLINIGCKCQIEEGNVFIEGGG